MKVDIIIQELHIHIPPEAHEEEKENLAKIQELTNRIEELKKNLQSVVEKAERKAERKGEE